MMSLLAIFLFPGLFFIFFSLFCSFMVVWRLRIRGWGLELCFWDWGFQSMGLWACGVRPSVVFGVGALYKDI